MSVLRRPRVFARRRHRPDDEDPLIFAGSASPRLTAAICQELGVEVGAGEVIRFPEGTLFVRVLENVRGRSVYLVQSTVFPANDELHGAAVLDRRVQARECGLGHRGRPVLQLREGRQEGRAASVDPRTRLRRCDRGGRGRPRGHARSARAADPGVLPIPVDDLYAHAISRAPRSSARVSATPSSSHPMPDSQRRRGDSPTRSTRPWQSRTSVRKRPSATPPSSSRSSATSQGATPLIVDDFTISGGTLAEAAEQLVARGARSVTAV